MRLSFSFSFSLINGLTVIYYVYNAFMKTSRLRFYTYTYLLTYLLLLLYSYSYIIIVLVYERT